jgi:hypothetical protein
MALQMTWVLAAGAQRLPGAAPHRSMPFAPLAMSRVLMLELASPGLDPALSQ